MLAWEMMIEHGGATEGTGGVGSSSIWIKTSRVNILNCKYIVQEL